MEIIDSIETYKPQPAAVTVGVFDGLHLGHQALLRELVAEAHARNLISVVVTFEPHPRIVLSKGNDRVGLITSTAEKAALIEQCGIDRLVVIPFTRQFSDLTARQFINNWLKVRLDAKFVLLGYNHHFGSDDVAADDYISLIESEGISARRSSAFSLPGGTKVSSTEIRNALETGNIEQAALLLGHFYPISGNVVHGDAIGRQMGFPTANIVADDENKLIPKDGVYAGWVILEADEQNEQSQPFEAVVNIGSRPTIGGDGQRIEAHIIGFQADVYNRRATIYLATRMRDEQKFNGTDDIGLHIAADIEKAKNILSHLAIKPLRLKSRK